MRKIATGLHVHEKPSGTWTHYSWLLVRPQGNFLIACANVGDELAAIQALGGLSHVFITDIHFVSRWHGDIANHCGATLVCHETDEKKVAARCRPAKLETVGESRQFGKDLLGVHTPGHADGGLCFLWNEGRRRLLFTGDFLCNGEGQWRVFCGKSKRKRMAQSLAAVERLGARGICAGIGDRDPGTFVALGRETVSNLIHETAERFCG